MKHKGRIDRQLILNHFAEYNQKYQQKDGTECE